MHRLKHSIGETITFGGLLAIAFIGLSVDRVAAQQNPNGVIPLHTTNAPHLFLVRDPVVHEAAKLTNSQKEAITKLNDRLDLNLWDMRNAESMEAMGKVMASTQKETQAALRKILKPEQFQRIQQVEYWVLGVKSLLRDDVVEHVGVSSDQLTQIRNVISTAQKKLAGLKEELQAGGDRQQLEEQWGETKHEQQKGVMSILSDEQQTKFRAMLGDQVQLSRLGRIKMKVPEFKADSKWVNSEPLTMEKLKGKVVALHFYAFA